MRWKRQTSQKRGRISKLARLDLLLLDLNMPGGDGLSFAMEVRTASATPIIIISGKGQTIDRVVGLEVGADDYLAKPFELRELLARIRAVLRRSTPLTEAHVASDSGKAGGGEHLAQFGGVFVLRPERRRLETVGGDVIDLTGAEYSLLTAFVDRANRVLTRDTIAELVQRADVENFDRSIDTLVSRLRRKLASHADAVQLIQTVRGEGYVLASNVAWSGRSGN